MNYKELLKSELLPAFGCTEPIALAFVASKVREVLGEIPEHIEISCSGNMIKNAKSVIVPGAGGKKGIEISCALGVLAGNPKKELEVLTDTTPKDIERATEMIQNGYCTIKLVPDVENLYIAIKGTKDDSYATVIVEGKHTNIIHIEKNHNIILHKEKSFHIRLRQKPKLTVK